MNTHARYAGLMGRIKKRILAAVIRSQLKSAFNGKSQTLLIAVGIGVCVVYLVALKRRRALTSEAPRPDAIAALAYQIWQGRGRPYGSDKDDWLQAERELKGRRNSVAVV